MNQAKLWWLVGGGAAGVVVLVVIIVVATRGGGFPDLKKPGPEVKDGPLVKGQGGPPGKAGELPKGAGCRLLLPESIVLVQHQEMTLPVRLERNGRQGAMTVRGKSGTWNQGHFEPLPFAAAQSEGKAFFHFLHPLGEQRFPVLEFINDQNQVVGEQVLPVRVIPALTFKHKGAVRLAFANDGLRLASRTTDPNQREVVKIWRLDLNQHERDLVLPKNMLSVGGGADNSCLVFHDGVVAMPVMEVDAPSKTAAGRVFRWNAATGEALPPLAAGNHVPMILEICPDGKWLAGGHMQKVGDNSLLRVPTSILLWDWKTGQEVKQLHDHQVGLWRLGFAQGGRTLVSCDLDGKINAWDLASGKLSGSKRMAGPVKHAPHVAVQAQGNLVAWHHYSQVTPEGKAGDIEFKIWDLAGGREWSLPEKGAYPAKFSSPWFVHRLAFAPSGSSLAQSNSRYVLQCHPETAQFFAVYNSPWTFSDFLTYSRDGARLATCDAFNGVITVWTLPPRQQGAGGQGGPAQ